MKVVFMGTPQFAATVLEKIYQSSHKVVAVVCQPDKQSNRGKTIFSPVKQFALNNGLPLFQFEKISRDGVETLKSLDADIIVTAAYGQILSQAVLNSVSHGVINVHGSLLPDLRGASPVQSAILLGKSKTGVSILQTVFDVDAGDVILQREMDVGEDETSGELFARMAIVGGDAVVDALTEIESGKAVFTPQRHEDATFTKKIPAEKEKIDWTESAREIHNLICALSPTPAAWTFSNGKRLKVFACKVIEDEGVFGQCGEIFKCDKNCLQVACGKGLLSLCNVQCEGGKQMDIKAYLCGNKLTKGSVLE